MEGRGQRGRKEGRREGDGEVRTEEKGEEEEEGGGGRRREEEGGE